LAAREKKRTLEDEFPFLKKVLSVLKDNTPTAIFQEQKRHDTKRIAKELSKKKEMEDKVLSGITRD